MTTRTQGAEERVRALIHGHGRALERVARSISLCADDADEAIQRALEIYLRRLATIEPATEGAWMKVVVRNEALAVRRARSQHVSGDEPDLDAQIAAHERPVDERIESAERLARSAEALRHLKRDEAHALMLKAEGFSYQQIGERLGWTYTKVNRCITEGRRRFFRVYRGIEAGEECERFAPVLRALVDGGAAAQDVVALRPHLRACPRCRAELRRLHGRRWSAAAAFLPLGLVNRLHALVARVSGEPAAAQLSGGGAGGRGVGTAALVALCIGGAGAGGYGVVKAGEPDRPERVRAERLTAPKPGRSAPATRPRPAPRLLAMVAAAASQAPARAPATRTAVPARAPSRRPAPARRQELGFEASGPPAALASPPPARAAAPATLPSPPPPATAGPAPAADFGFER